jgi:GST-like protein
MIDLHFVATPNGHKLSIMLLETGLQHRIIRYNMLAGDHRTPEFLAISPNGRAPAIVDHDPIGGGASYPMFETGAILIYLAEKSARFLPTEPRARYRAHQWLMWQMSGLGPMHGQAHHFVRYAPDPPPYAVSRYMTEARRLLGVMDARLAEAPFLAGDEYSIADIACWSWVRAARAIDIDLADYPSLAGWFDRVGERPAVQEGAYVPPENHQLQTGSRKMAVTPEQWAMLFPHDMLGRPHAAPGA